MVDGMSCIGRPIPEYAQQQYRARCHVRCLKKDFEIQSRIGRIFFGSPDQRCMVSRRMLSTWDSLSGLVSLCQRDSIAASDSVCQILDAKA